MKNRVDIYNRKNSLLILTIGTIFCLFAILSINIGFSAYSGNMSVDEITALVRPNKDVRLTSVLVADITNDAVVTALEYSVDSIASNITMPDANSTISYDIGIKNYGMIEVGISEINIPDNLKDILEVTIVDYELGTKLRDKDNKCETSVDGCKLAMDRTITLKVEYKDGVYNSNKTTFDNFKVEFKFVNAYKVTYTGFTMSNPSTNIDDNTILHGQTFKKNIGEHQALTVKIGGVVTTNYSIDNNNNLTVPNVTDNLEIIITEIQISVKLNVTNATDNTTIKYKVNNGSIQTTSNPLNIQVPKGSSVEVTEIATSGNSPYFVSQSRNYSNISSTIDESVTLDSYYTVELNTNPSASIQYTVNGKTDSVNSSLVKNYAPGTKISVTVSKDGYKTKNLEYTVNKNIKETIVLTKVYTLTIEASPTTAPVLLTIGSTTTEVKHGHTVQVDEGSKVKASSSLSGYAGASVNEFTMTADKTIILKLTKLYTLTVKANVDESISISDFKTALSLSSSYANNSCGGTKDIECIVSVPSGTEVSYSATADYHKDSGTSKKVVSSDSSVTINMSLNDVTPTGHNSDDLGPEIRIRANSLQTTGSSWTNRDNALADAINTNGVANIAQHWTRSGITLTWVFNRSSIPIPNGYITLLRANYTIGNSLASDVTVTFTVPGLNCHTDVDNFSLKSGSSKMLGYRECAINSTTLPSGDITISSYQKSSGLLNTGAIGYWYGADLVFYYIPK